MKRSAANLLEGVLALLDRHGGGGATLPAAVQLPKKAARFVSEASAQSEASEAQSLENAVRAGLCFAFAQLRELGEGVTVIDGLAPGDSAPRSA